MSDRQDRLRAELWESTHKEIFDKMMKEYREMDANLKVFIGSPEEYKILEAKRDSLFQAAEHFFMKFHE